MSICLIFFFGEKPLFKSVKFWPLWQMMRLHFHGTETPQKEEKFKIIWKDHESGVGWLWPLVQYLIRGEFASLSGRQPSNNWVKHILFHICSLIGFGLGPTRDYIGNAFTPSLKTKSAKDRSRYACWPQKQAPQAGGCYDPIHNHPYNREKHSHVGAL